MGAPKFVRFGIVAVVTGALLVGGTPAFAAPDDGGTLDSTFGAVMFAAETVRINPASTSAQVKAQKNLIERIATQSGP